MFGIHNSKPDEWYKPDKRGAGYFNICQNLPPYLGIPYNGFGAGYSYQYPRTGVAYFGLGYLNGGNQDYIQTQLRDSCKNGKKYYAEYYVNLSNASKYGCNNVGMLFTKNVVYADTVNHNILLANPQILSYGNPIVTDTMGWVKISGIFAAQGGEQYVTLGNFKSQANTQTKNIQPTGYDGSGYYVDDVAVYSLDSFCLKATAGADVTIKNGDSAFIGSYTNGIDSIRWFNSSGQLIDSTRPGFYVKPTTTGNYFYIVQQTVNGCFTKDTVFVNVTVPLRFTSFSISQSISSPIGGVRGGFETANEVNVSHFNIQRSNNGKDFETIGTQKANNKSSNEYNFTDDLKPNTQYPTPLYYRVEAVDKDGRKTYSEIRTLNFNHSSLNVAVFPNPAKDYINIVGKGIKEVKIFDAMGREISRQEPRNDISINQLQLTINNYPRGLYLVQVINSKNETIYHKLIVE